MSKSLIIALAVVAVILLLLGGLVEAVKFLLYIGLVVLVIAVVLWILGRVRSKA
ncbi:hypothetical protein [Arthrobacter roseus]|uniref:hypothetical protein n=1 Tax=Arthrobacter roseus TaxID=136274 RepID=UPI0019667A28|nr:hypothetical protein [Arthrobacter roseus]MBM7849464.1 lysylphosphatidylglycerol synthetase-like protein (DUF2156 family) [Arthrobacter roseus]